jgi:hypothetical protein
MKRRAIFVSLLFLVAAIPLGAPQRAHADGSTAAKATDYKHATTDFVNLLATGAFEDAYGHLGASMARALPPSKLEKQWQILLAQSGPFQDIGAASDTLMSGKHVVDLTTRFEWKTIVVRVAWDSTGAVSGVQFRPVPGSKDDTPPANSPARQMEIPLRGEYGTGGDPETPTASLSFPPISGKKIPAVIVVSKRDRKTLGDLAASLQGHGIAVLRWEQGFSEGGWSTECIPALRYLQNCVEVDRRRIFLIWESPAQPKSDKKNTELAGVTTYPDIRLGGDEANRLSRWILGRD